MLVLRKRVRSAGLVGALFGALAIGGLAVAPAAVAQQQSPAQARCLTRLAKGAAKLAKAQGKAIDSCISDFRENGGNAYACLTADPKQKVARAAQKLIDTEQHLCGETPDFGFVGASELISAVTAQRISLVEPLTGWFLLPSDFFQPWEPARCTRVYLKFLTKLLGRKLRGFEKCLDGGLADASIQSAADIVGCFSHLEASSDPKVGKVLDSLAAKAAKMGCDWSHYIPCTPDTLENCAEQLTRCRACEMLRIGGDLTIDCDMFDDGVANGDCTPACGDGEVDTGLWTEECDDGNLTSGDGCDSNCTVTACGNGFISPGEYCDYQYGSNLGGICVGGTSDGLPCAYNSECEGGYCTSCAWRGSCNQDCSACGPPFCLWNYPELGDCVLATGSCFGQLCVLFDYGPCDAPICGTEGDCRIEGVCVPAGPAACAEYEGVPGSCILGS